MGAEEAPATLRFTRRNLPHWLVADSTYFVTIRLAGTIPRDVLKALAAEREALAEARAPEEARLDLLRKQFVRIDKILDRHQDGRDWLTRPAVAAVFFAALPWLEEPGRGWDVYAVTLMSTHLFLMWSST